MQCAAPAIKKILSVRGVTFPGNCKNTVLLMASKQKQRTIETEEIHYQRERKKENASYQAQLWISVLFSIGEKKRPKQSVRVGPITAQPKPTFFCYLVWDLLAEMLQTNSFVQKRQTDGRVIHIPVNKLKFQEQPTLGSC